MATRKFISLNDTRYQISSIKRFEKFENSNGKGVYIYYGPSRANPKRDYLMCNSDSEAREIIKKLRSVIPEAIVVGESFLLPNTIKKYEPVEIENSYNVRFWFGVGQTKAQAETVSFDHVAYRDELLMKLDNYFGV